MLSIAEPFLALCDTAGGPRFEGCLLKSLAAATNKEKGQRGSYASAAGQKSIICYFFLPQSSFAPADNRGLSPNGARAVDVTLGFSYFGFLAFPRC